MLTPWVVCFFYSGTLSFFISLTFNSQKHLDLFIFLNKAQGNDTHAHSENNVYSY